MISIIICSQHPQLNESLIKNIKNTIATEFEIIHIDNSDGALNIFQAYNKGERQAKGDILCFIHEDIQFHTLGWGKIVCQHMKNDKVGALGIAGGNIVLENVDWRFHETYAYAYLRQGTYLPCENPKYYILYDSTKKPTPHLLQVALIDGVFMCFRRDMFKEIRFDDENYDNFHLYDSDICMQVNMTGKGVYITGDICIEHFSAGTFSEEFCKHMKVFSTKWKDKLPFQVGTNLSTAQMEKLGTKAKERMAERVKEDAMRKNIRRHFEAVKNGDSRSPLGNEEKEFLRIKHFQHAVFAIKNKNYSRKEAWKATKEHITSAYADRKTDIFLKFIWHKLLGHK